MVGIGRTFICVYSSDRDTPSEYRPGPDAKTRVCLAEKTPINRQSNHSERNHHHGAVVITPENKISDLLAGQIRTLVDHRDDEIQAKAMCALTTVNRIDSSAIDAAANMIEDDIRHVVFAGVHALTTVDQVPDYVAPSFDRSFVKALKSCDYEFVALFTKGYNRWHDDPKQHLEKLLCDSPEFLPIALEALDQTPQEVVNIG